MLNLLWHGGTTPSGTTNTGPLGTTDVPKILGVSVVAFGGAVAAVVVVVLLMVCGIIVCVVIVCAVKTKHRVNGESAPSTTPFPRSTLSLTVSIMLTCPPISSW